MCAYYTPQTSTPYIYNVYIHMFIYKSMRTKYAAMWHVHPCSRAIFESFNQGVFSPNRSPRSRNDISTFCIDPKSPEPRAQSRHTDTNTLQIPSVASITGDHETVLAVSLRAHDCRARLLFKATECTRIRKPNNTETHTCTTICISSGLL